MSLFVNGSYAKNSGYARMMLKSDCGPVALANALGHTLNVDCSELRSDIMRRFGFPGTEGLLDDLWDSPTRHETIVNSLVNDRGLTFRIVEGSPIAPLPQVVLLRHRKMPWVWHWVTLIGRTSEGHWLLHFGMGQEVISDPTDIHSDTWSEVLRYSAVARDVGSPLAWYWRLWGKLVSPLVGQ